MNRLRKLRYDFENTPKFQIKFNLVSTYVWMFKMIALPFVFYGTPGVWAKYSVFYLVFISIFANFATSYGALAASEASDSADEAAHNQPVAPTSA